MESTRDASTPQACQALLPVEVRGGASSTCWTVNLRYLRSANSGQTRSALTAVTAIHYELLNADALPTENLMSRRFAFAEKTAYFVNAVSVGHLNVLDTDLHVWSQAFHMIDEIMEKHFESIVVCVYFSYIQAIGF